MSNRRDFLKMSAAATAAALVVAGGVHAAENDTIKVGLIGCGGRGTGAAFDVLRAAPKVEIVALGDAFEDRLKACRRDLANQAQDERVKQLGNKVSVKDESCFFGLDAYKKVIDYPEVNYVILATPPGFRPMHLAYAVAKNKHIFTEKPVAVDGPGIRTVYDAYESAKKKKLAIVAGTQRRHQASYLELMKRIHGGEIGELVGGRCYWNQAILWQRPRTPNMSDLEYQMRNWYNFTWLCGDHIVEQHVHNIDVLNWAFQNHPVKAVGMGFRTRTDPRYGHIYDFFATDYEWENGVHTLSMCRQISNCANNISEALVGTKGTASTLGGMWINGKRLAGRRGEVSPYIQEHTDLIASIREKKPLNEARRIAESSLVSIMGREAAYTGQVIKWDELMKSNLDLSPPKYEFGPHTPRPVRLPGKTS